MDITQFVKQNDIHAKMIAAIEDIRNGNGWTRFDGLQNGECTVNISYDGENIHFTAVPKLDVSTPSVIDAPAISPQTDTSQSTEAAAEPSAEEGVNVTEETQTRKRRTRY